MREEQTQFSQRMFSQISRICAEPLDEMELDQNNSRITECAFDRNIQDQTKTQHGCSLLVNHYRLTQYKMKLFLVGGGW